MQIVATNKHLTKIRLAYNRLQQINAFIGYGSFFIDEDELDELCELYPFY